MTEHKRQPGWVKLGVPNVQVGAADAARTQAEQHLTGARLGTGRALVGVVIAEFLASNGGIGFYISLNGSLLQTARVYFGIILLGVLGVLLGEAVRTIERRYERWRPAIR